MCLGFCLPFCGLSRINDLKIISKHACSSLPPFFFFRNIFRERLVWCGIRSTWLSLAQD
uniref:Uncharacterized protein n=1 Tax=Aegilops tauschii subsp. strangulata TaxID=200361 RepID=A0A453R0W2_AEGTS